MRSRSPLYAAAHSARYERQQMVRAYQDAHACRLIVVRDRIVPRCVPLFEELLIEADPDQDLHVMLDTRGGDGEIALRMIRQARPRCRELTVIVPDRAKSAGTLFALGADRIYMGPTSDLGPIDPQLEVDGSMVSARTIIEAVEEAERSVEANPATYPLYASLLSDITALLVRQAHDALDRTGALVRAALASANRTPEAADRLAKKLEQHLVDESRSHAAIVSAADAKALGLPVEEADPNGDQWQDVWALWTKFLVIGSGFVYEGEFVSHEEAPV